MKVNLSLVAVAASLSLISCQKDAVVSEESIPVVQSSRNNYQNDVPFKGDYITTAQFIQGPAVQIIRGVGEASHLGESSFVANATVNLTTPPPFAIAGTAVFTAANGDQFFTQFTGTNTPLGNGIARGILNHVITGGTGRFEDATGAFTGIATVNQANPTNTVSFDGWIQY